MESAEEVLDDLEEERPEWAWRECHPGECEIADDHFAWWVGAHKGSPPNYEKNLDDREPRY